jgi:hypothetical protein
MQNVPRFFTAQGLTLTLVKETLKRMYRFLRNRRTWITILSFLIVSSICFFAKPAKAELVYGQAYPDIGTFANQWGKWSFWVGWDANFSETYVPEGESYAWVVYFAPEAIYVALQSSKSIYSGVNVNAGFKYFYGVLNLSTGDRLTSALILDGLHSVGLSKNLFSASTPGVGVGFMSAGNLSFALSAGLTFLKEKATGNLKRGIQIDSGLSVSYDLVSVPLPFSVSLGTDCDFSTDPPDPPELCKFYGFYPILIWNLVQQTSQNPVDLVISELEKTVPSTPQSAEEFTKKMLLDAIQIMQSNTSLCEFMESLAHNSGYDSAINETQQWLDSGDTNNLPENVELPDPAEAHQKMKPIFAATQMAFELGYQLPSSSLWADCVVVEYCTPGQECVIEITAEELAALFPELTAADFEGSWLLIDNPVEKYLVSQSETEEWLQIVDGKATFSFMQNTDTPIMLGLRIDPDWSPVDVWVHPCSRVVYFTEQPSEKLKAMPWIPLLLLGD